MGDAEDLILLRQEYERALASYESICSILNRYMLTGARASSQELERERDARDRLEAARQVYLERWRRARDTPNEA